MTSEKRNEKNRKLKLGEQSQAICYRNNMSFKDITYSEDPVNNFAPQDFIVNFLGISEVIKGQS